MGLAPGRRPAGRRRRLPLPCWLLVLASSAPGEASGEDRSGGGTPPAAPAAPAPSRLRGSPAADASDITEPSSSIPKDFTRIDAEIDSDHGVAPYKSQADLDRLVRQFKNVWNPTYRELPPVPQDGGPLAVGVKIKLVKFRDLDEVAGTADVVLDLMLCWSDDRLAFDADQVFHTPWSHAGDKLPITSNLIWTPDIVVLNQVAEMEHMFTADDSPIVLADTKFKQQTGVNVLWTRRINLKSRCSIDMSHFPFDVQQCSILIGSWASSRRQMLLVPQNTHQEVDSGGSIHTSEFQVRNITVRKREVYMRNAAERFEEVRYNLILQRYPHYWMVNFLLPMAAITMLTVATMWMTSTGTRVNSATRLLLCIVQIMNISATWRPANDADIWLDRFQSHCLALAMASVLQSLVLDYLQKTGIFDLRWTPRSHVVDTLLRTMICITTIIVFVADLCELSKASGPSTLYGSFEQHSTKLLVAFLYMIFMCLGASSVFSTLWLVLPDKMFNRMCCKGCSQVASGSASPILGRGYSLDDT